MIVDTHCHASMAWFEPVEALIDQMNHNGVEHAVLVQIRGQYDNEYQFDCVARYPRRLTSVVAVDPAPPRGAGQLAALKARGARGVRMWASWLDERSLDLWRAAGDLHLPVSVNGSAAEFAAPEFAALVESLPGLSVVIEHLGTSTNRDSNGSPDGKRRQMLALARFPNVYMKIHGLGEFAARAMPVNDEFPFVRPLPPRLQEAYDAFGASRMMWGSNFPPVSGVEGYRNSLRLTQAELAHLAATEQQAIFGGTASAVYGLING